MAANKNSLLFNGGKILKFLGNTGTANHGIKFTKNTDKSWTVSFKAIISEKEAEKVIYKFSDLPPVATVDFEKENPNMPYFQAIDDDGDPIFVDIDDESEMVAFFDRKFGGSILIRVNLQGFGKTQNPKTQNSETQPHPDPDS